MSIQYINMISNRLSLRAPQRDSLEILSRICEIVTLGKSEDTNTQLEVIKSEFPHIESFDRNFISLCFALATGVGKTRLMGAFISYLHLCEGIRHFMVLSPNLTIYNKLITDFTPNTPKYVFKGIGEFAQLPPLIVTGDNYETGLGIRQDGMFPIYENEAHINIFNIAKITAKDKGHFSKDDTRSTIPRMRRLSEYIGESYFDYLSNLDDLVILMDESHRYRASAGMAAINELNPILGLELTATPHVERGQRTEPFKNVIYNYPLSSAMSDGFVKEPAVATRENFDAKNYSDDGLEMVKLEDGVHIHEVTKADLEIYARNNNQPIVKPFMLIVAMDTTHANSIKEKIESDDFFEGAYKDKVITVHSKNTKGGEGDDIVQQLLTVEDSTNPVEIVIHVNMLKEGWDVSNLYTIVPLRAANSKTLVEQSIGRGLRLPYGKRVGEPAVDRLTIVSHDKFQEIVDHANDPNSIIRAGVIIGRDIPEKGKKAIIVETELSGLISGTTETNRQKKPSKQYEIKTETDSVFESEKEQEIAKTAVEEIKKFEHLKGSQELQKPEVQKKIVEKIKETITTPNKETQPEEQVDIAKVVETTTKLFQEKSIDIPKIIVVPKGDVDCGFKEFDLDTSAINLKPVSQDILIQHLQDRERFTMQSENAFVEEKRLEDYIVRGLISFDDIYYDEHSTILYKLASQAVTHLKSYLTEESDVINVLQFHQQTLVKLIYAQMQEHFYETATEYEVNVTKGFQPLVPNNYSASADETVRDFRIPIPEGQRNQIKSMLFGSFQKCLYPIQKFDSDSERRFAVVIENDPQAEKWFKPAKGNFRIHYSDKDNYEPDFVVETSNTKYLCEPKRASEMTDEIVLAKAKAAAIWCKQASEHTKESDGKEWKYLLIPHDQISEQKTLEGLAASCLIES